MNGSWATMARQIAVAAVVTIPSVIAAHSQASADTLILQGSTTFNRRIIEPHQAEVEAKSGHELTIIPNRTMLGIVALMEGRAHMAMMSAPLVTEVAKLKQAMPGLDYDRLKEHRISSTRVALVVNASNPLRKMSLDVLKKILLGEITNWRELGGRDAPIRMFAVGGGGGVITSVEAELLDGRPVKAASMTHVRTALQLISVTEQERDALSFAQLSLARQKGLPEVVTERPIEQSLTLITLGEPTPAMQAVIDAMRQVVGNSM